MYRDIKKKKTYDSYLCVPNRTANNATVTIYQREINDPKQSEIISGIQPWFKQYIAIALSRWYVYETNWFTLKLPTKNNIPCFHKLSHLRLARYVSEL